MPSAISHRQHFSSDHGYGADNTSDGPIIDGINQFNNVLNSPLLSSVGQTLNYVPIAGPIAHVLPDLGGHLFSKMGEGFAHMLGEQGSVNTHFEHEWLGRDKATGTRDSSGLGLNSHHHRTTTQTWHASNDEATHSTTLSTQRISGSST
ncbi:hypothetical protein [Paraburkholderia rhizosphaerae]|uniref:Uncharacterized protein n=1 Tax=Paraburkholderia rhizosphaerae TaxID=480658 RepID=A0A4R8LX68_9BURK|nr:hypothetical protein [Paraburkholderia rhizosphaerae]TDY52790.1 hypothetical protein BX592_10472 [Paraburkholderia rhizosphaerae]